MKQVLFALFLVLFSFANAADPSPTGLAVGEKIVDFGMRQVNLEKKNLGEIVWLTDFVGTPPAASASHEPKPRKKALVLAFWATWCKPCIEEMPFIQKLHETYGPKGVQVLGINFRNDNEKFDATFTESLKILAEKKVTYPVLFDRFTTRNQLIYIGSKAILPTLIVIDAEGTIVAKYQGEQTRKFEEIEKKIKDLAK